VVKKWVLEKERRDKSAANVRRARMAKGFMVGSIDSRAQKRR